MKAGNHLFEFDYDVVMDEYRFFYKCVLTKDIGEFKEGHKFETIMMDSYFLRLHFFNDREVHRRPVMIKRLDIHD